jgi:thiosulfate dehydrogenase (quinone) large subunit
MFKVEKVTEANGQVLIQDPPIARFLFQGTVASWFWLVVRVFAGFEFLSHGWQKVNTPAWVDGSGNAILTFWNNALGTTPTGAPVVTYDWYRSFLQFLVSIHAESWFSYVIVGGELAVGLGLILGAFVGLAATGGLLMNMAFLLAGTTSTNPILAGVGVLLILAWKNAGYVGLDRYLLPLLGTPWKQTTAKASPSRLTVAPAPSR